MTYKDVCNVDAISNTDAACTLAKGRCMLTGGRALCFNGKELPDLCPGDGRVCCVKKGKRCLC